MRILMGAAMLLVSAVITAANETKEPFSPHLKYKKGPVCMCNDGLSEKDIRDAMQKREKEKHSEFGTTIKPDETLRGGEEKEE